MRFSLLILLFSIASVFCNATTISCSNAEYAGKQLYFYKLSDPISGEKELVFSLILDANGEASATVKTTQIIYVFCDFGVYRGMLFMEPKQTIKIKLPPLREKSFGDQKNPYFSPASFWFISESKNQLTDKVNEFEQQLNLLSDKYFNELYFQQSKVIFDSVQTQLNNTFPEETPATFIRHKNFKTEYIRADIFRLHSEDYSKVFDGVKPEFWTHQSFIALFEKTFDSQLSFSAKAIGGKKVSTAVQKQDVNTLLDLVKEKYQVSGKMAELVLLKLLYDGFYSGDFSKTAIANMVASKIFMQNTLPIIKTTAQNIHSKFSFLQKESTAPEICLSDFNGDKKCTNTNTTKFKYIIFADAETIVCQEHLKYLDRLNELFNKHLEIFVILRNTDKKGIEKFFTAHNIPVIKLIDTENYYVDKYKIRSFPQCFLFDENHRVAFTSTNAPLDGFEQQFGTFLRNELFMRQRNQSR